MNKMILFSMMLGFTSFNVFAKASATQADKIEVQEAYVRAMPKSAPTTAAFAKITNQSDKDVKLVKISSQKAKSNEIHAHEMKDGMMSMKKVDFVTIDAKKTMEFKPGGFHFMLIDLVTPTVQEEQIDIELTFEDQSKKTIKFKVK